MERLHLLAAEIFKYSYANYEDHLGVNERFDKYMPHDAALLETALEKGWPVKKVAQKLGTSTEIAERLLNAAHEALTIVDADNPAESYRNAVRQCVQYAIQEGLHTKDDIESLVVQICYRAADLGLLLEKAGHRLSQYSRHLRRDAETEYHDGYFEEPFQTKEHAGSD